ncbi:hypothetical protein PCASD_01080, partial [Puccinia coronata f. sp. avenae]
VEVYLSSDCEDEAYNPLSYWNANNKQFPTLSNMARTFLAVPASSAPTERAFSSGRYIQDYTRNQLNPNTLQSLICLKNWLSEKLIDQAVRDPTRPGIRSDIPGSSGSGSQP